MPCRALNEALDLQWLGAKTGSAPKKGRPKLPAPGRWLDPEKLSLSAGMRNPNRPMLYLQKGIGDGSQKVWAVFVSPEPQQRP